MEIRKIDLEAHLLETLRRTKRGATVQGSRRSGQQNSAASSKKGLKYSRGIKDGVMTEEIVANKENKGQESDGSN